VKNIIYCFNNRVDASNIFSYHEVMNIETTKEDSESVASIKLKREQLKILDNKISSVESELRKLDAQEDKSRKHVRYTYSFSNQ